MLYHDHFPTDIEWKTTLTMFFCDLNLTCYQFPYSNVTVWNDMFKKETIVWLCVISSYSTGGIWGVDVLPDYAANW